MKLLSILALLLCAMSSPLLAQSSADEVANVIATEKAGCAFYLHNDAANIAKFLTSDYTFTDSKGEISTAADDIDDARLGRVKYTAFENYDMKARVYNGATAIVLGKTKVKGTVQGASVDIVVEFTDTFIKQDGRWRLAAGHGSRLKQ